MSRQLPGVHVDLASLDETLHIPVSSRPMVRSSNVGMYICCATRTVSFDRPPSCEASRVCRVGGRLLGLGRPDLPTTLLPAHTGARLFLHSGTNRPVPLQTSRGASTPRPIPKLNDLAPHTFFNDHTSCNSPSMLCSH